MAVNNDPLRITEEGDVIEIYLTEEKTPVAYQRKKYELMELSGMTEQEAERYLSQTPVPLELFYDMDRGMFGVESDALESCEIYNPYTGKEIPNDNLPAKELPDPRKRLDEILGELENLSSELRQIWEEGDFSLEDDNRIEEAREAVDEALAQLHSIGDEEIDN
jgi:hypothetical protein